MAKMSISFPTPVSKTSLIQSIGAPEVFSPTRIKVAPVVTLVGYITIIASILVRPKGGEAGAEMATQSSETNVTEA